MNNLKLISGAKTPVQFKRSDDPEFERLVFAEVVIPNVPNVYGDIMSEAGVREFAYGFMRMGYGIDVDHDNFDIDGVGAYLVESFIAREGDADFIKGSWVVGMHIVDDDLWQAVLSGEINGYSYEAIMLALDVVFDDTSARHRSGETEPDPFDGHTHVFMVLLDDTGRVVVGGTDEVNGHSHNISSGVVTEESSGHTHRFNVIKPLKEVQDESAHW